MTVSEGPTPVGLEYSWEWIDAYGDKLELFKHYSSSKVWLRSTVMGEHDGTLIELSQEAAEGLRAALGVAIRGES